jgi:hypothetical protein
MWSQILQLLSELSNHFIFLGVAICVTLVAIWAGQSRLHWFWRGCLVAAVLALFLPVRAHEPLLFFLIVAPVVSLSVAWMESRRECTPGDGAPAGTDSTSKKPTQLSLAEAFLVLALVGMGCGLGSAAYRGGLLMDWRCLPVSALMFAAVAILSYRVGAFSQGMPHRWAKACSYLIGAGLLAWFVLRGRDFSLFANTSPAAPYAWWGCLVLAWWMIVIVWYYEMRFGSPRHFVALVGMLIVAPRIELDSLGDWMFVDELFHWYQPGARFFALFVVTIAYGLFAAAIVVSVAIGRLAFSMKAAVWQKHLARTAGVCAAGLLLYSLGGVFCRLAWNMAQPPVVMTERGQNPLEQALPMLDEFYSLEYPGQGFVPGTVPKGLDRHEPGEPMAEVYARLVEQLQKPGWAPLGSREASISSRQSQELVLSKLTTFSAVLDADAEQAMQRKDFDAAMPYVMAQLQMGDNLHREGFVRHRWAGALGMMRMAALRNDVSTANARQVLTLLRRFERDHEPFDVTFQREQAWEDREQNWRSGLRRLEATIRGSAGNRSQMQIRSLREADHYSPTLPRLLATELALRLYREDHGRLPRELEELVPQYLDSVPIDPFSDKPLVYRAADGKFQLYTVWTNRLDEGGKTGKGDAEERAKRLPVDYDLDAAVRFWLKAMDDAKDPAKDPAKIAAKAKAAREARVQASMLKHQQEGQAKAAKQE